ERVRVVALVLEPVHPARLVAVLQPRFVVGLLDALRLGLDVPGLRLLEEQLAFDEVLRRLAQGERPVAGLVRALRQDLPGARRDADELDRLAVDDRDDVRDRLGERPLAGELRLRRPRSGGDGPPPRARRPPEATA